jgi:hypothetical protein
MKRLSDLLLAGIARAFGFDQEGDVVLVWRRTK